MVTKIKTGIIAKIPHLCGKSETEAEEFFKKFSDDTRSLYNMKQIKEDWYIERVSSFVGEFDNEKMTMVYGCTLEGLQEYADEIMVATEFVEPEYYNDVHNWCNPHAYFFIGDWKDETKAYCELLELNQ